MGARLPVYYCPPGVAVPAHARSIAPNQLAPGTGPDQQGGATYGNAWTPDQVWHPTAAGWWVCLDGVTSRDLMRTAAIAGIRVADAEGRDWLVPRLLDGEASFVGYWTPAGFAVPAPLAPLVDQLRTLLDYTGKVTLPMAELAAAILAVNYHVSLHELGIWQAFSPEVVMRVLAAAAGIPPQHLRGVVA